MSPLSAAEPRLQRAAPQDVFLSGPLESLLPPDHPVRNVRSFVAALDLSDLLASIRSVEGSAGRPAIDPRILLTLWLFATAQGVGSSRELARLCTEHLAYQWVAGGVDVGYHTLADFRTGHGDLLDRLLSDTIAVLLHEGLIELKRVAQDGMRVRAAAGTSSFHREPTLDRCLEEARGQVEALRRQEGEDRAAPDRRSQAARHRAAAERLERLELAKKELQKLRQVNEARFPSQRQDPAEIRVSTTDPESRKMKMPDGGYRPAYNVQFATTTVGGAIVGVDVTKEGTDAEQLTPMLVRLQSDWGTRPEEILVDGGYATVAGIDEAQRQGTTVYAPVKEEKKQLEAGKDPYARKRSDTDATAEWRARMGTPEAKTIYRERASTAEWANAGARNRGMYAVTVRGLAKVRTMAMWQALVHNMGRLRNLRARVRGEGAR